MKRIETWLTWLLGPVVLIDLYLSLIWSPKEKTMGDLIRIMYFHVGSVWASYVAFTVTLVASVLYLILRNVLYDQIAGCSAEIGVLYTTITLITGSIWAKPMWNTWWTWDPRLTTTLLLWFLYVFYLLLRGFFVNQRRRALVAGIFSIIAFADIPVIHFAVEWWNSIHPQVIDETGIFMPGSMFFTLSFSFFAFSVLYMVLLLTRFQQVRMKSDLKSLQRQIDSIEV